MSRTSELTTARCSRDFQPRGEALGVSELVVPNSACVVENWHLPDVFHVLSLLRSSSPSTSPCYKRAFLPAMLLSLSFWYFTRAAQRKRNNFIVQKRESLLDAFL